MSDLAQVNTNTNTNTNEDSTEGLLSPEESLNEKIVFTLTMFPKLTPSMLQVGVGPHIPPRKWRPLVEKLILDGTIKRSELGVTTPIGQYRTYTVLSLTNPIPLQKLMERYRLS